MARLSVDKTVRSPPRKLFIIIRLKEPNIDQVDLFRQKLGAEKVFLHGEEPSNLGARGTGFYFIQQAANLVPICRVLPESTADVATALAICREVHASFAVKSGGMGTYAGAANIENGVTIDLVRFKNITISEDRKTVIVGTGCRWGEVYNQLDKAGLSIIGGRVTSVGVGGLALGGRKIYPLIPCPPIFVSHN